jgi:hypothetical protein
VYYRKADFAQATGFRGRSMTGYKITGKDSKERESHRPELKAVHNVVAWGAIRELFRLRGDDSVVSEEEIQKALRLCLHSDGKTQETRYLKYVVDLRWLEIAKST